MREKKRNVGKCVGTSLQYYFATIIIIINYFKMAFKLCGAGADWLPSGFIKQHLTSGNPWWLETNIKLSNPFG